MAVNEPRAFQPKMTREIDPSQYTIDYDRASDTLSIFLGGAMLRPAISVPFSDYEYGDC